MDGSVMGSKSLTPTRVGKMASKCLLLLFKNVCKGEIKPSNCRSVLAKLSTIILRNDSYNCPKHHTQIRKLFSRKQMSDQTVAALSVHECKAHQTVFTESHSLNYRYCYSALTQSQQHIFSSDAFMCIR